MKQADIVVGTEYVYLSYGDYNPTVDPRPSWRGGNPQRVRIVSPPSGGNVVVEFVDHKGTDKVTKVRTRNLYVTWAQHEETLAAQTKTRDEALELAAELRRSRREAAVHVHYALDVVGEKQIEQELKLGYSFDAIQVGQELADLGFVVFMVGRFGEEVDDPFDDLDKAAVEQYWGVLHVVSPGNIAAYAAGLTDKISIEPASLLAISALV